MNRISLKSACITRLLLTMGLVLAVITSAVLDAEAKTAPVYHSIPAYQQKNVFESDTMTVEGLTLEGSFNSEMTLYIFNTTTQELEATVTAVDGTVPTLTLKKEHNYMILGQDGQYKTKSYCWAHDGVLYDIKSWDGKGDGQYSELKALQMEAFVAGRDEEENRYYANIPVMIGDSDGPAYNRKFKLVSMYETLEVNTGSSGCLRASLLEDIAYTVVLEDDNYFIQSFPLVVKDKREYDSAVRFTYDHSTCHAVGNMPGDASIKTPLRIYEKASAEQVSETITSLSEKTTISGFKFNDIIALERYRDDCKIAELDGEEYDVLDIVAVNPHRWEISKLCTGNFNITENLNTTRKVEAVYELKPEGLNELEFIQSGKKISFTTDSLSINPVVIKYQKGSEETPGGGSSSGGGSASGGGSSSGGGSAPGGSGGGGGAPAAPETGIITNSGNEASGNISTNINLSNMTTVTDGKAEAKIDAELGGKIVENAVYSASKAVAIDAGTSSGDAVKTEVSLPAETFGAIAGKTDAESVSIKTDAGTVDFDRNAILAVADQSGTSGDVKLVVETKEKNKNKVELALTLETSGGTTISDFKSGNVTVTVPVSEELAGKKIVCVYIDENGKYTKMEGKLAADGKSYTFTTGHFSTYAILEEAEADAVIDEQNKAEAPAVKVAKASVKLKAYKGGKLKVTASAKNATGYRVYYKKSTWKKYKTYTKGNVRTLNKTFRKLSKGKYTVKVKAYNKSSDGKVTWGAVSAARTVRIS